MEDRRKKTRRSELRNCVNREVGLRAMFLCLILPLSLINRRVSVDVKLHGR